jgi:hypothetical protein
MKKTAEEIEQAAHEYAKGTEHYTRYDARRFGFIAGVNYAMDQFKNEWVPVNELQPIIIADDSITIVKFDTGEIRRYDEDWPFAIVVACFVLPQPPTPCGQ